jgi:hypothetical protein
VIPKRIFWFTAGAVTGFGGALYGYARVREAKGRLAADRLADTLSDTVVGTARSVRGTVREALQEGRETMEQTQDRLERDLRPRPRPG